MIHEVGTGSCNACEMEMNALMNPIYDAEWFGIQIVASPRHGIFKGSYAVSGPVDRHIPVDVRIPGSRRGHLRS
jgi:membrane-bound hydrogenase subunit mbhJ